MLNTQLPFKSIVLETKELATGYLGAKNRTKVVSKNLHLSIKNGEFIALLGPNGSGKSTLMKTLSGLQKPLCGDVEIANKKLSVLKTKDLACLISLVLTERIEMINLKVWDVVSVGRYPYMGFMGNPSQIDKEIISQSLADCGLSGFQNRLFSELSDGEKQKVMIARALAQDTPLIILDEPTAHLDLPNRIDLMRMLYTLSKKTSKSILISTHELDLAMQWADTIWLMDNSGNIDVGCSEDLVLNKKFSSVFDSAYASFDLRKGIFQMKKQPIAILDVSPNTISEIWLIRALERRGFSIGKTGAVAKISYEDKHWILNTTLDVHKFDSIGKVLTFFQKDDYWVKFIDTL